MELEAEAAAYIVTTHLGLEGASAGYVSRHLDEGQPPRTVSLDMIAKVAGRIERIADEKLPTRGFGGRRLRPEPISGYKTQGDNGDRRHYE